MASTSEGPPPWNLESPGSAPLSPRQSSLAAAPPPPPPLSSSFSSVSLPTVKRTGSSVQFQIPFAGQQSSLPRSKSFMSRSPLNDQHGHPESSADEITPIIDRERGGSKDYRTTTDHHASPEIGEPSGSLRRLATRNPRRRRNSTRKASPEIGDDQPDEGAQWWRNMVEKYGSVELDNKGSVARDHLALERTFLAWLRTSLAFASIGIAITQLFRLNTTITDRDGLRPQPAPPGTIRLRQVGKPLGATFLGIAILVLGIGGRRYFESQYWIIRGKFPASRGSICVVTVVATALIVTTLVINFTVDPSQFEKK